MSIRNCFDQRSRAHRPVGRKDPPNFQYLSGDVYMNSKPPPQVQYRRVLRFINLYLKPAPWLVRDHFLIAFCPLKRMFGGNLHGHICSSWPGWPWWPEVLLGGRFLETLAKTKTTQAVHQISAKRRVWEGPEFWGPTGTSIAFFFRGFFFWQFCWIYHPPVGQSRIRV